HEITRLHQQLFLLFHIELYAPFFEQYLGFLLPAVDVKFRAQYLNIQIRSMNYKRLSSFRFFYDIKINLTGHRDIARISSYKTQRRICIHGDMTAIRKRDLHPLSKIAVVYLLTAFIIKIKGCAGNHHDEDGGCNFPDGPE